MAGRARERRPSAAAARGASAPRTARRPSIAAFERRLGHAFRDRSRLEAAWVHRSAANERKLAGNYERLEFLGDAVLGLLTAEWLFREFPDLPEGDLARLKSTLVSAEALARYARSLGLGVHLVLGQGEERSGGRDKTSLLADSLEAVMAAVYLDAGLRAARKVVDGFLRAATKGLDLAAVDAKSELQERLQALGREAPTYRVSEQSGPDHAKVFTVEVVIGGEVAGSGTGRSKKAAELEAARRALEGGGWDLVSS
ncbi:MAG TPA: ribonuclease III [Thermoanaerobaculia bacterium]|nr:ribonuclease III [Thermoanaerobaculia bacterium]